MPTPWTKDEEKQLIKEIKSNKTFDEISKIHNRTISAIMMRYNKIVYDNVTAGKSKSELAKILNTTIDKITQSYYEHKAFVEKKDLTQKQLSTENIDVKTIMKENKIMKTILKNICKYTNNDDILKLLNKKK